MKSQEDVDRRVDRIERRIDFIRRRIHTTEDRMMKLAQLNERRRKSLRELGQKRAETLTFDLPLDA